MSNALVGTVYQSIIEEVINSSRIDFEEAGVNATTLEDLKQVWQQKLSDLKVAHFPWDPAPPEQVLQLSKPGVGPQVKTEAGVQNGGPKVKSEPDLDYANTAPLIGTATHNPHLAAIRAQQNIAQKFGSQPVQARPQPGLVLPGVVPQQQPPQPQQRQPGQPGIPQLDGEDEDSIPIEGFGHLTRQEADQILLRRIGKAERERARATEEFSQALQNLRVNSSSKGKGKRRVAKRMDAYEAALDPSSSYPYPSDPSLACFPSARAPHGPRQVDGESDDDVADEDAINSDLDDPEDDEIDDEGDEEVPQIMLCMYDKVQRTKNKWKCVLKDGVLTINNQEYVFHKANGEYEW